MFEVAEIGSTVDKDVYKVRVPQLRVDLVNGQFDLRQSNGSLLVIIAGDDQTTMSLVVNTLDEWLDTRFSHVHVLRAPTAEERAQPAFHRVWDRLPAKGEMAVLTGGVTWAISQYVLGHIDDAQFDRWATTQRRTELGLLADGMTIVKVWLHVPKVELGRRLRKAKKDERNGWRLDRDDQVVFKRYDDLIPAAERYLARATPPELPWLFVETTDIRHAALTTAEAVLAGLEAAAANGTGPVSAAQPGMPYPDVLAEVDLSACLEYDEYKDRLNDAQSTLRQLWYDARECGKVAVLVFEGWDAAGKGGTIRRITSAMEPGDYQVHAIAAPSPEELAHPYLWRFWRRLPAPPELTIFDRSWYGRVLVERVEEITPAYRWQRAYGEINEFEAQLTDHGWAVCKFWLHIDPEEQLRRFEARRETPYKKYKITDEDLRNRDKWEAYYPAVNEMVSRTSTVNAPWHLIPACDKRLARVQVIETVVGVVRELLAKG